MSRRLLRLGNVMLALGLCVSCGNDKSSDISPEQQASRDNADLRIGHVMIEVGHRMETAGRAGEAEQWELAAYEVHEIIEVFDDDMTRALLPGVCNDDVVDQIYFSVKDEQLPALRQAAEDEDADGFRAGFATVAASCNGCHATCEVAFIEVPTEPGIGVPRIAAAPTAPPPAEPGADAPATDTAGPSPTPRQEVLDPWAR